MELNIYEAKANLSKIINELINETDEPIYICKYGKPVAQIIPINKNKNKRIGAGKELLASFDYDEFESVDLTSMFYGDGNL